jgi:hypothetical protein
MIYTDLEEFERTIPEGIITQLYTVGGGYIECWTRDIQTLEDTDKEFYPLYYLGGGLRLQSDLEAGLLLETGDITSDGGIRNKMLYSVQQGENILTEDDYGTRDWYEQWLDLYDQYRTLQSYMV